MPDYFEIPIVETTAAEYDVAQEEQYNKVGINFDALRKLFGSEDQDVEEEPLEEIRLHSSYRFGAKNLPPARTQRVILYSGSTENSFHGHTFKELNISTKALWDTFGSREEGDVDDPWWLDVQNPTESELRLLCSALRVHPLTVEDILNQETREKIDDYTTYYYVCFWSCRIEVDGDGKETYKPYNTYMVVFPTGTLSISYAESEHPDKVLERIKLLQDYVAINSDWIFYAFVDDIVDSFSPTIAKIEKRVDEIEDQVYTTRRDDMQQFLQQIETFRKHVSSLNRLLSSKTTILTTFEKHYTLRTSQRNKDNPGHELYLYIDDVQDHVVTMLSNLRQFDSLLIRSQSNFVAGLAIDTVNKRTRVNNMMTFVSILAMCLTLSNWICGMFSMNVNASVPLYTRDDGSRAWWAIIGSEVILTFILMWIAKRLKWW